MRRTKPHVIAHDRVSERYKPAPVGVAAAAGVTEPDAAAAGTGRRSVMAAAVDGGSLALTPDPRLLDDTATTYPVFLDPSFTGRLAGGAFTTVWSRSDLRNSSFWMNGTAMNNGAVVGNVGSGLTCDRSDSAGNCTSEKYNIRSFFRMDTAGIGG